MGIIRQTKRSCNNYWTDIIYHNPENYLGSSSNNPIILTLDAGLMDIELHQGLIWLKFTMPYSDEIDFWLYANGLANIPTTISDYATYQSDASTIVDISSGNATAYGLLKFFSLI